MSSSLDQVEFLARSESRVTVLDAIAEGPRTRNELKDLTDASRFTLSRTLADFEDRGSRRTLWASCSNSASSIRRAGSLDPAAPARNHRGRPRRVLGMPGDETVAQL